MISKTICLLLVSLAAAGEKTVSFGDATEIVEEDVDLTKSFSADRPKSILRNGSSSSSRSRSTSSSKKPASSRKSIFDSDSGEDELFADTPSSKTTKVSETRKPTRATEPEARKPSSRSTQQEKKPTAGLSRFKNRGPIANPVIDTLLTVLDSFIGAFQETIKNEFVSEEEIDAYEARNGQIMRRKDPTEMAFRIARPAGWLAANMWAFYDFPGNPMFWGAMLIINMGIILAWRQYDLDWMITEMGHWDYALGLAIFLITGLFSLLHQGVNFLTKIFFAMAPTLILTAYTGYLAFNAIKKRHQYYY